MRITNIKNLPVAEIDNSTVCRLMNPEILTWEDVEEDKKDGRGLVWVDPKNPIKSLHPELFLPVYSHGEMRLALSCYKGRYGPLISEGPEPGDRIIEDVRNWPFKTRFKCWVKSLLRKAGLIPRLKLNST